ncbi:hypothetical protein [Brevundimonas nasdae]|uniref:Uncharacterized protein n=1 Tax=Brevundimonas nasdae TaxID=172043 RepID=A0ABX8TGB2_9CAUL|nr:hypothetical protein [Brevundimonas nasdae]QYC09137.1 hypothetical protein KWG56_10890 [Brevundimonas nasdae]QYC15187.1 hypothetical protein KWG63_06225 [Brevundimonas nasdae]
MRLGWRRMRFTIAVIPDTRNYVDFTHQRAESFAFDARDMMVEQMRYIADNAVSRGGEIVFATGLGDVWQHSTIAIDPEHAARGFSARPLPDGPQSGMNPDRWTRGVREVELPASIAVCWTAPCPFQSCRAITTMTPSGGKNPGRAT